MSAHPSARPMTLRELLVLVGTCTLGAIVGALIGVPFGEKVSLATALIGCAVPWVVLMAWPLFFRSRRPGSPRPGD